MILAASTYAAAQNAMRAPLNIVPPAMQQAIGQPKAERSSDKLAPRVAARQSKRAVRAVAAAPGSESSIVQVGQLGALQDAPIGLETGYGSELWRGARLAFIADQMARLPKYLSLAALREAELTLHRSTTAAPVGTVDGSSWYAARLNRFLALGDTASVLQLEELTGAVSSDPYAARAIVLAPLGRGAGAAACSVPAPKRGTRGYADTLTFFMQLLVYCQLRAGEFEKAGLTLQLNEKSLGEDRFYRDLAFLMSAQTQPKFGTAEDVDAAKAEDTEAPLIVPSVLTPMQLVLLQLAGYGLNMALEQLPPYFMQSLAEDYAQPPATQLGAALAAMRHGSLSAERFSQLSQLSDLSAFQNAPQIDDDPTTETLSLSMGAPPIGTPEDAVFLALTLLKVDAVLPDVANPLAPAQAIISALAAAEQRGLWRDMVLLLDDRLLNLALSPIPANDLPADTPFAPSRDFAASAAQPSQAMMAALIPALRLVQAQDKLDALAIMPSAVALRLLNLGAPAQAMENLIAALPDTSSSDTILQATQIDEATNAPNAGFANEPGFNDLPFAADGDEGAPADTRPHPIVDWQVFEAEHAAASPALKAYLTRELAVYEGLGFELPAAYRIQKPDALDSDLQRVQKLAENKWVGDLLLALVDKYGAQKPTEVAADKIVALLAAMRQADLHQQAEDLATEFLLNAAGQLSLADPAAFLAAPVPQGLAP